MGLGMVGLDTRLEGALNITKQSPPIAMRGCFEAPNGGRGLVGAEYRRQMGANYMAQHFLPAEMPALPSPTASLRGSRDFRALRGPPLRQQNGGRGLVGLRTWQMESSRFRQRTTHP